MKDAVSLLSTQFMLRGCVQLHFLCWAEEVWQHSWVHASIHAVMWVCATFGFIICSACLEDLFSPSCCAENWVQRWLQSLQDGPRSFRWGNAWAQFCACRALHPLSLSQMYARIFRHSIYTSDKAMHVPFSKPVFVRAKPFVSNLWLKCVLIHLQGHLFGNSCGCVLIRIIPFERVMCCGLYKTWRLW